MKCEHCGKNEASFFFHSNINGKVEERRLCAPCAQKLGYARSLRQFHPEARNDSPFSPAGLLGGFFAEPSLEPSTGGGDWHEVSPVAGDLFNGLVLPVLVNRMLDNPFDDLFSDMPALGTAAAGDREPLPAEQGQSKDETPQRARDAHQRNGGEKVPQPQDADRQENPFARERQLNALRLELQRAVQEEEYERAAQVRDRIRLLEGNAQI